MVLIWTLPKKFQSQDLWNWGYASLDSSEKWTKQQQEKNRFTNWENATCDERGNGRWVRRNTMNRTTKTNKTKSCDVSRPGKHKLQLSKNAAWGKTRVSWSLLEAPEKTGPVQSHDCSIAIAEGFLNSVVRSWGPPVTLCCTDSIWEGVKMRGLLLPSVLQIFTTTQQLPLYCPPTGAFGLTVFVHFLAVASC